MQARGTTHCLGENTRLRRYCTLGSVCWIALAASISASCGDAATDTPRTPRASRIASAPQPRSTDKSRSAALHKKNRLDRFGVMHNRGLDSMRAALKRRGLNDLCNVLLDFAQNSPDFRRSGFRYQRGGSSTGKRQVTEFQDLQSQKAQRPTGAWSDDPCPRQSRPHY